MTYVRFTALGTLLLTAAFMALPTRLEAAPPSALSFSQSCTPENTVTVSMSWTSDPSARELWVDASTTDDLFAPGTFTSEGPLGGRTTSHQWRGLEPHSVYWFRVNQLLPSGDWQAGPARRYVLGCGNVTAPAGAIQITGFTDGGGGTQTPPNGRLRACNPARLFGYIRVSGLKEITDVTYIWYQGSTLIQRYSSALDSENTTWTVAVSRPSGMPEGPYSLEVWTGGHGNWRRNATAAFTLDC